MALITLPGQIPNTGITVHTRAGSEVQNTQSSVLPPLAITQVPRLEEEYGVRFRTAPSAIYNCHGLTFASRRTAISDGAELVKILREDNYTLVDRMDVLPGDIILYISRQGEIEHSGIVMSGPQPPFQWPYVLSKWGFLPEAVHYANRCPYPNCSYTFYRILS